MIGRKSQNKGERSKKPKKYATGEWSDTNNLKNKMKNNKKSFSLNTQIVIMPDERLMTERKKNNNTT